MVSSGNITRAKILYNEYQFIWHRITRKEILNQIKHLLALAIPDS